MSRPTTAPLLRGRYLIEGRLGAGSQGAALTVRDVPQGEERVLKLFDAPQRERARESFELLTELASPQLPTLHGYFVTNDADEAIIQTALAELGEDGDRAEAGRACLVRGRVDGRPADAWVRGRSWGEVRRLLWRLGLVLSQLHGAGVLHGDLKPEHVVVGPDDLPVLIDFGLATRVEGARGTSGTPLYMAPERFLGEPLTAAGERYAFGVLAYALLAGRPPFEGRDLGELARAHREAPVPPLPETVPAPAAALVAALLDKDPVARPGLEDVLAALHPAGATTPSPVVLPFVGREAELERALDGLDRGRSLWVGGAPGLGRTRFLQQLRWRAEIRGWRTVQAPATSAGLVPLVQALGAQLAGLAGRAPASLPALTGDRLHQWRAVAAWLEAQAPSVPPVVFWDDADRAPDVLAFLSEALRRGRLVIVASAPEPPAEGAEVLSLPTLPEAALESAAREATRTRPTSPAALRRALARARGSPRRLVLALAESASARGDAAPAEHSALGELLAAAVVPLDVATLGEALECRADALLAPLHALAASGYAARLEEGFLWTAPRTGLAVRQGKAVTPIGRAAAALRRAGREDWAVVAVVAGDTSEATVEAAVEVLERSSREHDALHVLAAVVSAGEVGWCDKLVGLALELGRADVALEALPAGDAPELHLARARLLYTTGRLELARDALEGVDAAAWTYGQRVEAATLRAWVALRAGRPEEAARLTEGLQTAGVAARVAAELATARAGALLLAGREEAEARAALEAAQEALGAAGEHAALHARLLTFRALAASRRGDLAAACEAYDEALGVVERAGLDADLPTFLLNAGTAHDHLGTLDRARELYRRGAELGGPATSPTTRVLLRANRANVALRLGRLEEAGELLEDAAELTRGHDTGRAGQFVAQLRGELALRRGEVGSAREQLEALAAHFDAVGDRFARAEVGLQAARAALEGGDPAGAERLAREARALIEEHELADLRPLLATIEGELALGVGRSAAALGHWREAMALAGAAGDSFRVLEAAARHVGLAPLEGPSRHTAAQALQRVTEGLGAALRRDYLAALPERLRDLLAAPRAVPGPVEAGASPHIGGTTVRAVSAAPATPSAAADEVERLHRLLALTARLARQEDEARFLEMAVETAIELSGAERGFLLLAEDGAFRVALSRDVDGEPIRRALLEVSITIAERVAATAEPLVTVDARSDDRFDLARSVHQLALTSILCLPIRSFGEVVGVMYLDHRFREAAFPPELMRLMMAFADQLAVALLYLARVRDLERQKRELEDSREEVRRLLAESERHAGDLLARCESLESDLLARAKAVPLRYRYEEIVATTPAMRRVLERVDRVVDSAIPVLVSGESGTGKELVARAIHDKGRRKEGPFVPINCGAIPETLLESELFGHVRGAFTGADRAKPGLFVAAHGGTVLLDEVGELPLASQVKLLRVLQERKVRPVGGVESREVDVRLIAATNRDLLRMVEEGRFRTDLYYRIAGLELVLPPLRERREDVPPLVERFVSRLGDGPPPRLEPAALRLLLSYDWPGNVRQLESVLNTAWALSDRELIRARDVEPLLVGQRAARPAAPARTTAAAVGRRGPRPKVRREAVLAALREAEHDIDAAAHLLGVSPRSVYRYIKRWRLAAAES